MVSLSRGYVAALACTLPLVVACSHEAEVAPPPTYSAPKVDLRADNNRNGTIDLDDPSEDDGEDSWDSKHGAVFLANIDDDLHVCPVKDASGKNIPDVELPNCNDAANDVIDGDDDLLDLARLKTAPWAEVPAGAHGSIELSVPERVRLFKNGPEGFVAIDATTILSDAEIASGLDLAIEGRDIVRDPAVWDGFVDLTYRVTFDGIVGGRPAFTAEDRVRMRVAPVLLQHHGLPAEKVFATRVPGIGATDFRADIGVAMVSAKLPSSLEALDVPESDPWTQDFFETGYMSMPAEGGQHVIRVAIRSANIYKADARNPLRAAGRIVFTKLRGKDVAGIQQFDPGANRDMDTLNSFGNTEMLPPFEHGGRTWPLGRMVRGSSSGYFPDKSLAKLFDAQQLQQPVLLDTSWLLVGHVDETLSYVAANKPGPRSFVLLANDPRLSKKIFEDARAAGQGAAKVFVGKYWVDYESGNEISAERTVGEILDDADVMSASQAAAAEIDAQVEILARETGVTEDETVRIPGLHWKVFGGSVGYQPAVVNALVLDGTHIAAPDPHGPLLEGKDPFKTNVETSLAAHGVSVSWVEDWDAYHRNDGEVHCGSNVFRAIPTAKWWEVAR